MITGGPVLDFLRTVRPSTLQSQENVTKGQSMFKRSPTMSILRHSEKACYHSIPFTLF